MTGEQFERLIQKLERIENLLQHGQVLQHNWTPLERQGETIRQHTGPVFRYCRCPRTVGDPPRLDDNGNCGKCGKPKSHPRMMG